MWTPKFIFIPILHIALSLLLLVLLPASSLAITISRAGDSYGSLANSREVRAAYSADNSGSSNIQVREERGQDLTRGSSEEQDLRKLLWFNWLHQAWPHPLYKVINLSTLYVRVY